VVQLVGAAKLDEAEAPARDLLVRFPDVHDGWDRLGMVHEARGDSRQAADCYRKVIDFIRQHPDDYDAGMIVYFLGQASDRVGDVFHVVTRLVRHTLPDVLDQFPRNAITVSDALYLALTAVLIGAGFVFLRNTWRALAKARPGRWVPLPRFGRHRAVLIVLALGGGMALVWQYGDLPWLAGQLARSLWVAVKAAYGNRDYYLAGR
jgi:hypothetical protein